MARVAVEGVQRDAPHVAECHPRVRCRTKGRNVKHWLCKDRGEGGYRERLPDAIVTWAAGRGPWAVGRERKGPRGETG